MKSEVTIVDYGLGNLMSVQRALEVTGATVLVANTAEKVEQASRLLLPGVGAFADGMRGLNEHGMTEAVRSFARSGRPLLGICLGMQMLFDSAEEFGITDGLALIPGKVVAIPKLDKDGKAHKIPHIGWTDLIPADGKSSWSDSILSDVQVGQAAYFVHSYMAQPLHADMRVADGLYGGHRIAAVVNSGSVWGCQFHPEKSGDVGLAILRKFQTLT